MKIGNLVRSKDAWGPDEIGGAQYYPIGIVYRQHKQRFHRWWVEWVSPEYVAGEKECMLDEWLEVLNESR